MSESAPAGRSGSRGLLIGAGIGCGCLGLLAAAFVVVLIVIGVASRSGGGAGEPAGPGQPPAPQGGGRPAVPASPSVTPRAEAVRVSLTMVRINQSHQPVGETDAFRVGEEVGALARFEAVPQAVDLRIVWIRVEGDHVVPVTPPKPLSIAPDAQGKQIVFFLGGGPAGQYAFVIFLPGEGDQIQVVAARKFAIQ